ncbi:hypothetical protein [Spirochaeta dissipatitropha]
MSSITIHDIDEALSDRLTIESRRQKKSRNQLIKELLAKEMGLPRGGIYSDDYSGFCGLWTAEELDEFNRYQKDNSVDCCFMHGAWSPPAHS